MIDERVNQQVLGALMKHPQYLSQTDKYTLTPSDFSTRFEKYIFSAIYGLYFDGAAVIHPIDISNYLASDNNAKYLFNAQNGISYLNDIEDFCDENNFDYYYKKLKKLDLLRDLNKSGIDTSEFYIEDPLDKRATKVNAEFEKLSSNDIINKIKTKLLSLERSYVNSGVAEVQSAIDGIDELIGDLGENMEIGLPLQGHIYNEIVGGAQRGKFHVRTASSGTGKAIPDNTIIPTPAGNRLVKDIKVGDYLWGDDGQPTKVIGVHPQPEPKEIYKVYFEDGRIAECCKDHLWGCYHNFAKDKYQIHVISTQELFNNKLIDADGNICYSVPIVNCQDQELYPSRRKLLQKLLDNDNSVDKGTDSTYVTNNHELVQKIQSLCWSLGLVVTVSKEINQDTSIAYILNIRYDKINNGIIKIEPTGVYTSMTCFTVDNESHLFLMNDYIVTHNTRLAIGDACQLAYPCRFDWSTMKWIVTGSTETVLFIATEQSFREIRKLILAYLSGISESEFAYANFSKQQELILQQSVKIMKQYENNFHIIRMPDPSIELVKTMVRENCILHDIHYVFYDYIFISNALIREFEHTGLRNDEALLLLSTALKDLAVELNVFVSTSTQSTQKEGQVGEIKGAQNIAGAKAIINKADIGVIISRPTKDELDMLQKVNNYSIPPNLVTDVHKVRAGRWNNLRIWSYVDLGTMYRKDLFVTDANLEAIPDFQVHGLLSNWEESEIAAVRTLIKELNDGLSSNN